MFVHFIHATMRGQYGEGLQDKLEGALMCLLSFLLLLSKRTKCKKKNVHTYRDQNTPSNVAHVQYK